MSRPRSSVPSIPREVPIPSYYSPAPSGYVPSPVSPPRSVSPKRAMSPRRSTLPPIIPNISFPSISSPSSYQPTYSAPRVSSLTPVVVPTPYQTQPYSVSQASPRSRVVSPRRTEHQRAATEIPYTTEHLKVSARLSPNGVPILTDVTDLPKSHSHEPGTIFLDFHELVGRKAKNQIVDVTHLKVSGDGSRLVTVDSLTVKDLLIVPSMQSLASNREEGIRIALTLLNKSPELIESVIQEWRLAYAKRFAREHPVLASAALERSRERELSPRRSLARAASPPRLTARQELPPVIIPAVATSIPRASSPRRSLSPGRSSYIPAYSPTYTPVRSTSPVRAASRPSSYIPPIIPSYSPSPRYSPTASPAVPYSPVAYTRSPARAASPRRSTVSSTGVPYL